VAVLGQFKAGKSSFLNPPTSGSLRRKLDSKSLNGVFRNWQNRLCCFLFLFQHKAVYVFESFFVRLRTAIFSYKNTWHGSKCGLNLFNFILFKLTVKRRRMYCQNSCRHLLVAITLLQSIYNHVFFGSSLCIQEHNVLLHIPIGV